MDTALENFEETPSSDTAVEDKVLESKADIIDHGAATVKSEASIHKVIEDFQGQAKEGECVLCVSYKVDNGNL